MFGDQTEPFDKAAVLRRFTGREELLQELIEIFIESGPPLFEKTEAAVAGKDLRGLEYAAHSLKGMVGTFGATACADAALRLEKMARIGDIKEASPALSELETQFELLVEVLTAMDSRRRSPSAN